MKPRALDLFCCAGGATKGLQRAGFHVTGVDIKPQSRYCGDEFHQADALTFPFSGASEFSGGTTDYTREVCMSCGLHRNRHFDFIWASPPCEFGSQLTPKAYRGNHENLIEPTRERLVRAGVPFCIENVPSNAGLLVNPFMLCGSQFGLKVRRHRFFELNFPLSELFPPCDHSGRPVLISGTHRRTDEPRYEYTAQQCRDAAGLDWMRRIDMDKAIPPAYSEFIGRQVLQYLAEPIPKPVSTSAGRQIVQNQERDLG